MGKASENEQLNDGASKRMRKSVNNNPLTYQDVCTQNENIFAVASNAGGWGEIE